MGKEGGDIHVEAPDLGSLCWAILHPAGPGRMRSTPPVVRPAGAGEVPRTGLPLLRRSPPEGIGTRGYLGVSVG